LEKSYQHELYEGGGVVEEEMASVEIVVGWTEGVCEEVSIAMSVVVAVGVAGELSRLQPEHMPRNRIIVIKR